jgi:hypothetical protein
VIAALSHGTAPLSAAPAAGCLLPFPPLGAEAASPLSNVDTLLGMATTLWPIIHRLSNLLSLKSELETAVRTNAPSSKIAVLRTEFESTAQAIETALTQWQPNLPPNFVPDEKEVDDPTFVVNVLRTERRNSAEDTANGKAPASGTTPSPSSSMPEERRRVHSILHNALAYRHSAFVYLYRTVHARGRSHALVQNHAHLALAHCVATVSHAGPMSALLWPLFVAACEAVGPDDRELAERAFDAIARRQGMMNIERAWDIVKEVWRRADFADRERERCRGEGEEEEEEESHDVGTGSRERGGLRVGDGLGGSCRSAVAWRADRAGVDLWRRVSEEMGVNIVFG